VSAVREWFPPFNLEEFGLNYTAGMKNNKKARELFVKNYGRQRYKPNQGAGDG
jgi:hypothetical protein